jgi:FdrA protein
MRHVETRPGMYRDSVALMQISSALSRLPVVESALVAMATELNLELLVQMGFEPPAGAVPTDLLVAVRTASAEALSGVLARLDAELTSASAPLSFTVSPTVSSTVEVPPRTTGSAVRALRASVVLVSTPGQYAFVEAMDALDAGASVLVFSDNVPVHQEIRLKQVAAARGLLVMGPDCGTAVVGGVGLGFANVVRPGPVGLVAASGTGAQHVMSLLSAAPGAGISHCLGVGGRDMQAAVGALSTRAALAALDADPATELIVVLGKPPAPAVAESLRALASTTPVVFAPLGIGQPDLTEVAESVLSRLGLPVPSWPRWVPTVTRPPSAGSVQGLFSGGTLCTEAMVVAAEALGPIRSNVPIRPEWTLDSDAGQSVMLDLGADEYTLGRPHPMIDFGPRLALIRSAAADPACRVVLLDVVLGHGAHADPAGELAPVIEEVLSRPERLDVVVSLIGTADDPQDHAAQAARLCDAGAYVFASNAAATRHTVSLVGGP